MPVRTVRRLRDVRVSVDGDVDHRIPGWCVVERGGRGVLGEVAQAQAPDGNSRLEVLGTHLKGSGAPTRWSLRLLQQTCKCTDGGAITNEWKTRPDTGA